MKTFILKKLPAFILMMFSFALVSTQTTTSAPGVISQSFDKKQTINPVIGDISFVSKFGYLPDATTDENLRITTHFDYVEILLRQKDVSSLSPELQKNREHLINLFHDYKMAGKFPKNYDYPGERKPCFIDKDNTICAVGYLVEHTAGRTVAEDINAKFKYEDVLDMHDAVVDNWVANSGLSKEEVAMIQPTYCYPCPPPGGCGDNKSWVCRWSHCKWECKCVNDTHVADWYAAAVPCDTTTNGHNGHGRGNGLTSTGWSDEALISESLIISPNPVTEDVATFSFELASEQPAVLRVYTMDGRVMGTVVDDVLPEGENSYNWDLQDVAPGVYFVRLDTGVEIQTKKVLVTN